MNCFDCKIPCEYSNPLGYCYKEQGGLPHGPWEKDYQPSGISRAEEAARKAYPDDRFVADTYADMCRGFYKEGYEQAEKDLALKFKELREAQKKWKKTLNYGWRCEAVRLEKEVDELLNEMQDGE